MKSTLDRFRRQKIAIDDIAIDAEVVISRRQVLNEDTTGDQTQLELVRYLIGFAYDQLIAGQSDEEVVSSIKALGASGEVAKVTLIRAKEWRAIQIIRNTQEKY